VAVHDSSCLSQPFDLSTHCSASANLFCPRVSDSVSHAPALGALSACMCTREASTSCSTLTICLSICRILTIFRRCDAHIARSCMDVSVALPISVSQSPSLDVLSKFPCIYEAATSCRRCDAQPRPLVIVCLYCTSACSHASSMCTPSLCTLHRGRRVAGPIFVVGVMCTAPVHV